MDKLKNFDEKPFDTIRTPHTDVILNKIAKFDTFSSLIFFFLKWIRELKMSVQRAFSEILPPSVEYD